MEITKQLIYKRLSTINNLSYPKITAMDLHSQKNHLRRRVQRKADKLYKQRVEQQKKRLYEDLGKINNYELALQAEKNKNAAILAEYEKSLLPQKNNISQENGVFPTDFLHSPVFPLLSTTVPKPNIFVGPIPIRRRVRY